MRARSGVVKCACSCVCACVCIDVGGGGYLFWLFSMRLQCVESITIPSIRSRSSNMDVIYMVMQPLRLPQVTQWTSLTVDGMTVVQHPNAMYSHGHIAHTTARTCTYAQQGRHVSISRRWKMLDCVCAAGAKGRVYCSVSSWVCPRLTSSQK